MQNLYQIALYLLSKVKRKINIVVVGANDGKFNDPIYDFAMQCMNRTTICLIEPNTDLLPYLEKNYSTHPNHKIINCAIGPDGFLTLYTIKKEYWSDFQPDYAKVKGWPEYRAATGITSASRKHLEDALEKDSHLDADKVITSLQVPSKELEKALSGVSWKMPIDVLQIDAEGHDDSVIYSSNLKLTNPKYIYFELHHIPQDRLQSLLKYLSEEGYKTYKIRRNALSVKRKGSPLNIFLSCFLSLATNKHSKLPSRRAGKDKKT